jgi:hypothetical protein
MLFTLMTRHYRVHGITGLRRVNRCIRTGQGNSRQRKRILLAAFLLFIWVFPARAGQRVDLLLALAADVSFSMDAPKLALQREGYARAITNPAVLNAITSDRSGRIAVCFIEWSDSFWQDLVVDWTLINSAETARQFSEKIVSGARSLSGRTSISSAIDFAVAQLKRAPFDSARKIIDVSGDGDNNAGRHVTSARDDALAYGVTVNGLVILSDSPHRHTNPSGGLAEYYRRNVIGGPAAFVIVANDFQTFGEVLTRKLIMEVAQLVPGDRHVQVAATNEEAAVAAEVRNAVIATKSAWPEAQGAASPGRRSSK